MKLGSLSLMVAALTPCLLACSDRSTEPESSGEPLRIETIDSLHEFPYARSIQFLSETRGVIVTYEGKIGLTVDGGHTWSSRESHTESPLRDLQFLDSNVGYAVGGAYEDGVVLRTTDGGDTWTRLPAPAEAELHGLHFTSASSGYVVGLTGHISHTSDGGTTWVHQHAFKGVLTDVLFVDDMTGFACGIRGTLLKTTNGGQEWFDVSPEGIPTSIQQIDIAGRVGIAGARHQLIASEGPSADWAPIHELPGTIFDCVIVDPDKLLVVGRGFVYHYLSFGAIHVTLDGGESWIIDNESVKLTDLHLVDERLVVGIGTHLVKFRFE